jgi:hypothetical protein
MVERRSVSTGTTTWTIGALALSVAPAEGCTGNEEISGNDVCRYSVSGWESRPELRYEEIMYTVSRETDKSRRRCLRWVGGCVKTLRGVTHVTSMLR